MESGEQSCAIRLKDFSEIDNIPKPLNLSASFFVRDDHMYRFKPLICDGF